MFMKKDIGISIIVGIFALTFVALPVFAGENHNPSDHMNRKVRFDDKDHKNNDSDMHWRWWDENNDRKLSSRLFGDKEVPGPGDTDGKGIAFVKVKPGKEEICTELKVMDIDQATMAHIHKGNEGTTGPVVVTLLTPDVNGYSNACVSASKELLKDIKKNPSAYYINVHNAAYPDGAIRGQLQN